MKLIYSNFQFWIITFNLRILTSGSYFFWHGIVICRFLVEILVFWLVWPNLTSLLIFCFCVCLYSQLKLSHPDHLLVKRASAAEDNFDRALQSVAWRSWISLRCMVSFLFFSSFWNFHFLVHVWFLLGGSLVGFDRRVKFYNIFLC